MKGSIHSFFFSFLLLGLVSVLVTFAFPRDGFSQDMDIPDDFEITLTSAPNFLPDPLKEESIVIRADGTAWFSPRIGEDGPLSEAVGQLAAGAVEIIFKVIQERGFFELEPLYSDPGVLDGDYAEITVTANGASHQVRTVNVRLFDFDLIAMTINARVPKDRMVIYNALISGNSKEIDR